MQLRNLSILFIVCQTLSNPKLTAPPLSLEGGGEALNEAVVYCTFCKTYLLNHLAYLIKGYRTAGNLITRTVR